MKEQSESIIERLSKLESAREVSETLHRYMQICDYLDEGYELDTLMDLFTEDAVWEGKGKRYSKTFGKRVGIQSIRQMFEKYTLPPAHFSLNVHFLTSEKVSMTSAVTAEGVWVLLQVSTFSDGRSQLSSALLEVSFRREDEQWKIAHFRTTSRFNRPVETPWDSPEALPVPEDDMHACSDQNRH